MAAITPLADCQRYDFVIAVRPRHRGEMRYILDQRQWLNMSAQTLFTTAVTRGVAASRNDSDLPGADISTSHGMQAEFEKLQGCKSHDSAFLES